MRLRVDTRLPHDLVDVSAADPPEIQRNRAVYRITEVISESQWTGLYRAKKVFRNFDFKDRRIVEVDQDECLDVFVKTLLYPTLDQRNYVAARREQARFEARKVLGCRKTNLIPEPLGYLEVRNDEDVFTFARAGQLAGKEPILICEAIHGESLVRWKQRQQPELIQILRVLGELLELVHAFHSENMLLNNLGPAAFWIDSAHRVQFIGTENVIDQAKAAAARIVFPPQRYARGFAAPELSDPQTAPSTETDLFGWAALAYFLITGDSPARLAAEQQQPWAHFDVPQRKLLSDSLWSLTDSQIRDVQKWLGVTGSRFSGRWPDGFVDGLFACLDLDPTLRPPDVAAIRSWWTKAPPPRVPQALAVLRANGRVQLSFSTTGLPQALTYVVRRKLGTAPRTITEGVEVWHGTMAARVEDAPPKAGSSKKANAAHEEWHYSVFSQDVSSEETSSSLACPVPVLDGTVPNYARIYAEQFASLESTTENPSAALLAELSILGELETLPKLTRELLQSSESVVRNWAVQLLDQRLQNVPNDRGCLEILQQLGLNDAGYQLRRQSAAVLVRRTNLCDVEFIVSVLAPALGGTQLDDRIRAVRGMTDIGLSKGLIDQAILTFELDRLVECDVCQLQVRAGDIDEHLIEAHGFVPLDGEVLPFGEALKRLWTGILERTEPQAFRELVQHFSRRHGARTVDALTATFRQRFVQLQENPEQRRSKAQFTEYLAQLVRCFTADPLGEELCCHLLVDDAPVLNQLGRQFFLRRAARELAPEDTTVAMFRQWIEFLVPQDRAPEQIHVCEALVALGADPTVAEAIRHELELSRFTLCPECGESLQVKALGRHRRVEHQIFEFENQRFSLVALVSELANRLVSPESNLFTAMTIVELHEEQFGHESLAKLGSLLSNKIRSLEGSETRDLALVCAASSLAPLRDAYRLCHQLLKGELPELLELGLLLFGHLTRCPDLELARRTVTLVGRSEVSIAARRQATAALVRWSGVWPDVSRKGLLAYANGVSADPVERSEALQTLQDWTGESALIQEVCREQAENRRIRCPKCDLVLLGRDMPLHALTEHQRIFDGRNLRRPWSMAVEALETYTNHADPALLTRGEKQAQVEYPEDGLIRFVREALRRGIDPGNYRKTLEQADSANRFSICPTCFEPVARPLAAIDSVRCRDSRELSSAYVSIKLRDDSRIWLSSEVTGVQSEWTGSQPGWVLSRLGVAGLVLAATWLPAAGLLLIFGATHTAVLTIVSSVFCLGAIGASLPLMVYQPPHTNVIDVAWDVVVPHLLETEIYDEARSFVAGLCMASVGRGNRKLRQAQLQELQKHFDQLAARGIILEACLGSILRLQLHDALDRGERGAEITEQLTRLFRDAMSGDRPLSILNLATTNGAFFALLPVETITAIRWRILQTAQTLEWSFQDLFVTARQYDAFGEIICPSVVAIREHLADAWALLESNAELLKGGYITAPKLIDQGSYKAFQRDPDFLCQSADSKIRACSRGLVIDDTCYAVMPTVSYRQTETFKQTGWVHQRKDGGRDRRHKNNAPTGYFKKGAYELRINTKTFSWRTDPTTHANQIRALSSFLFQQIKLRSEQLEKISATFHSIQLFRPRIATCLNCGQLLTHGKGRYAEAVGP
jgi:hypothetical protein